MDVNVITTLWNLILAIDKEQNNRCTVGTAISDNSTAYLQRFISDLMVNEDIPALLLTKSVQVAFEVTKDHDVPYAHLIFK